MPSKRKHEESDPKETVHASRQFQVHGSNPKPAKKPRRFEPPVYKKQAHASSVNAIKKRIRDVTRRLDRSESLPANVRIEDERALTAFQQELASAEAEKIRQKMIKKYHMVRFFERQKATRQLKKLRKRVLEAKSTEEVETLKAQMHVAEVDLNYTQYCPLSEIYVSLYPREKSATEDGEETEKPDGKPPMWAEVEKCMEDGTLNRLRNRVPKAVATGSRSLEKRPAKPKSQPGQPSPDTIGLNRRQRRSLRGPKEERTKNKSMGFAKNQAFGASQGAQRDEVDDEQDGDSDGGFFEE